MGAENEDTGLRLSKSISVYWLRYNSVCILPQIIVLVMRAFTTELELTG